MKTDQEISGNKPIASPNGANNLGWGPVLLVENDDTDIFLFHRALRRVGGPAVPCHAVSNVAEAIRWLNELVWHSSPRIVPRLVVCDLRLREGTSFDLVEWMNRREEFRDVPVVLWAGAITAEDDKQASDLGISNTLTKSGDIEPLTEWLRTLLRNHPGHASLEPDVCGLTLPQHIYP